MLVKNGRNYMYSLITRLQPKKRGKTFSLKTLVVLSLGLILGLSLVYFYLISAKNASAAWYHDSWGFRRKLTIDNTKVSGSSNLTNFPVLVSFTSDTNLSANAKTDGSDILFVDARGVPLVHEIEYYASGTLVAWVQIPTLSTSTDTAIYMYYGNSTVSGLENESAVWSSDYRGVWHLAETSGQHLDSTTNNNDSTTVNVTTQGSATGKIGGASDFASGNEVIMADSDSLDISGSFTAQAWVKADTIGGSGTWNSIIYKGGNSNYFLELTNTDEIDAGFYGGGNWRSVATSNSPVSTGTFYHLAVVHDAAADTIKVYVDGVEKGSATGITQTPLVNTSTFTIGENFYNETFDGIIDEVRLSDSPKSVDWLLTEYNNQNSPSTFYSTGYAEERTLGPAAYWKFDEGYGTSVNDASGNSIIGTMGTGSSAPTWTVENGCISGKCIEMDGGDDYLTYGDNLDVEDGQDFTFTAWIKSNSFATVQTVLAKKLGNSAGQGGYLINIGTGGTLNFYAADGTDQVWKGSSTTLATNTWYHIAFVFDEDNASNISFYINGSPSTGSLTGTLANVNSLANAQVLGVGVEPDAQYVFNGFIDEAKFYPYARSSDEIKQDYLFASAKGAAVVLGAQDQSVLSDELVGYWKLDESASGECSVVIDGTTYIDDSCDSSGNKNSGYWAGDVVGTAGKYGNGALFDGTGDQIIVPDSTSLDMGNRATWSVWFKLNSLPSTAGNSYRLLDKWIGTGNQRSFQLYIATTDKLHMDADPDGTDVLDVDIAGDNALVVDTWYHVVVVADGSQGHMYVNGVKQSDIENLSGVYSSTADMYIGSDTSSNYFDGTIDEIRIYKKPLTSSEVKSLYEWAPGPVAYYDLNEGSGSVANDSAGTNNPGSLGTGSSAPSWSTGKYGKALSFDGTNDYVSVPDSPALYISEGTLSFWAKVNSSSADNQPLITKDQNLDNSGDFGISVRQSDDGTYPNKYYFYTNIGAGNLYVYSDQVAQFGSWEHIAVTFGSNGMSMYINGTLQSMTNASTGGMTNTTPDLYFMRLVGSTTNYTSGLIDEIRIYNYVHSQDQIIKDMNAGHPAVGTPVGSTSLHYSFDEGYGTTTHDKSPSQINGTFGSGSSSPSWTNDGKFNKALSFDGSDDYVSVPTTGLPTTDFTYSLWFNSSAPASSDTLLYAGDESGGNEMKIDRSGSGQVVSLRLNGSTACTGNKIIAGDTWYHVVAARSGSTVTTYINGEVDCTGSYATALDFGSCPLLIGADDSSSACDTSSINETWAGSMDEIKVYSFALTPDQIKTEFEGGKSLKLGAKSTEADGSSPSNASGREYCVPGDTSSCNAPILEWGFEEGNIGVGTTVFDTSTQGRDGTIFAPLSSIPGKIGKGVQCSGTGRVVHSNGVIGSDTSFTISLWAKYTQTGNDHIIREQNAGGTNRIHLKTGDFTAGDAAFSITGSSGTANLETGSLNDNKWHHITVAQSSATSRAMYVDGSLVDTDSTDPGTLTGLNSLSICGVNGQTQPWFDGKIDEVRIYDYARTPAQIAWEYNRGAPVAQYKFDECQGTTVYNSAVTGGGVAAGNNGTVSIGASGEDTVGNCSTSSTAWGSGASGKINSSLDFDGTDDYVDMGDPSSGIFDPGTGDYSVSVWMKGGTQTNTSSRLVFKYQAIHVNANHTGICANKISFEKPSGSAGVCSTSDVNDNAWHLVTAVRKGDNAYVYIDGKLENSQTGWSSENATTNYSLTIGGYPSANHYFDGQIDDVRIYRYALTSAQVQQTYNNGAVSFK